MAFPNQLQYFFAYWGKFALMVNTNLFSFAKSIFDTTTMLVSMPHASNVIL